MFLFFKYHFFSIPSFRFVWIDESQKTFFWYNTESPDKTKAIGIHLVNDVVPNGITCHQTEWYICRSKSDKDKNVCLMLASSPHRSENVISAAEWFKVANAINLSKNERDRN